MNKNDPKSATKPQEDSKTAARTYETAPIITNKTTKSKPDYKYNKRAFGRPSKYKTKYCQEIVAYFDREHITEYEETHTNRKGETWTCTKQRANPVPTLQGFSANIFISVVTLWDWKNKFTDFAKAYSHAQALQMDHLATVTGLGLYNSNWAVFMAKNVSDWRDKRELEHSGDLGFGKLLEGLAAKSEQAKTDRVDVARMN